MYVINNSDYSLSEPFSVKNDSSILFKKLNDLPVKYRILVTGVRGPFMFLRILIVRTDTTQQ